MTTIRQLVTDAFRENNLIQVGDVPEGSEYTEAERLLTNFISSLLGYELGESLKTITLTTADTTLPINSRVLIGDNLPDLITLSAVPQDGEQFGVVDPRGLLTSLEIQASGGTIEEATSVLLDNTITEYQWFYRADKGNWYRITNLSAEDESPLPKEFDDLLSLWLAIRIAPRMGAATKQESASVYDNIKKKFSARYRQTEQGSSELGLLRMTNPRQGGYYLEWETN